MIGRRVLSPELKAWNEKWGAPFGYSGNKLFADGSTPYRSTRHAFENPTSPDVGPFGFQTNSYTRVLEYPWAYQAGAMEPGMKVLDVGGGISGFQFVAAQEGCRVVNVDPTARADYNRWSEPGLVSLTPEVHTMLNGVFGTDVTLVAERLQDAELEEASFDRVFCLSVLEHVDPAEAGSMLETTMRLLKPGGRAVLTVDLFLDLLPFGVLESNTWGINHDVGKLVKDSGMALVQGDPRELLGFPEFDRDRVVELLPELLVSSLYPVMTQMLVLEKAERRQSARELAEQANAMPIPPDVVADLERLADGVPVPADR